MKIAVIFLSLCVTWLGGQAMYTNTGQLYASMAGRDLADDVTRYRRDVRSKLECAVACAESDYCGMFAVCRHGPGGYLRATSACTKYFYTPCESKISAIKQRIDEGQLTNSKRLNTWPYFFYMHFYSFFLFCYIDSLCQVLKQPVHTSIKAAISRT